MTEHLKRLRAVEVSYVPKGANKKKFLIVKEDGDMPQALEHIQSMIAKLVLKNDDKVSAVLKNLAPADADALKAALKVLQAMGDKVDPGLVHSLVELIGMPAPTPPGLADAQKELTAQVAKVDALTKEVATLKGQASQGEFPIKKDGTLDEERIEKSALPMVKALWNAKIDSDAKVAKVQKQLDEERDSRVTKEYNDKAGEFSALPVKKEELGKVLKDCAIASPEGFKTLETVLKAANDAIKKADPTAELGNRGGAGDGSASGDPFAKIEQAASVHVVAKGLSKEAGVNAFITKTAEGRKMYAEYKNSQGAKQ